MHDNNHIDYNARICNYVQAMKYVKDIITPLGVGRLHEITEEEKKSLMDEQGLILINNIYMGVVDDRMAVYNLKTNNTIIERDGKINYIEV